MDWSTCFISMKPQVQAPVPLKKQQQIKKLVFTLKLENYSITYVVLRPKPGALCMVCKSSAIE
jgi:hypothetical protein